ncbi:MAG: hypothetical protein A2Y38_15885 [Spirochaetes bacterium GWB1_59_5]|nr:MAG: hypothetical protein A2Y38_15885 [Spirochaetes bacterium GWB1_59_5]
MALQTLTGTHVQGSGAASAGRTVKAIPIAGQHVDATTVDTAALVLTATTDATGGWSLTLIQGVTYDIKIEKWGVERIQVSGDAGRDFASYLWASGVLPADVLELEDVEASMLASAAATPADTDSFFFVSTILKKLSWANLKALIRGGVVYDTDYTTLAAANAAAFAAGRLLKIFSVWDVVPETLTASIEILPGGQLNGSGSVAISGEFRGSDGCFGLSQAVTGLKEVRPEMWGAVGDGVTDDTAALQAALDCGAGNPVSVLITKRFVFKHTGCAMTHPNIFLTGGGELSGGALTIGASTGLPVDFHFVINGVVFSYPSLVDGQHGIILQNARYGKIRNCRFVKCDKAVSIASIDNIQHVNRLQINNNEFDGVNYCLYGAGYLGGGGIKVLTIGDIDFSANHFCLCKISHVYLTGQDGLVATGNFYYHDGYAAGSLTKEYCIYGDYIVNAIIATSQFFEAGYESIKLSHFRSVTINGNTIIWGGQRDLRDAIALIGGDTASAAANNSSITCNVIAYPSKSGISVTSPAGKILVFGNTVNNAGIDIGQYYGATAIDSVSHYGIDVDSLVYYVAVFGNFTPDNLNNFSASNTRSAVALNYDSAHAFSPVKPMKLALTGVETTFSASGITQVTLAQSGATTITSITDPTEGQVLRLRATNGNSTLSGSAATLKEGGTVIPSGQTLSLEYFTSPSGWHEVGRSF